MKKEQLKLIFFLFFLFLILNSVVYSINEVQKNEKIELELQDRLTNLETHYNIFLHSQSVLADAAYTSTLMNSRFIEIFEKIDSASQEQKAVLREQLYTLLKPKYDALTMQGVLQYHFVLPDNKSFLRMHKPSKFGDDLSFIREDFVYTNQKKIPVRGFTQGRTAHGFRNTYPIFAPDSKYLGVVEISFSSDSFQQNLKNISRIHTHFLVCKNIFDAKAWTRDDLVVKYIQSVEHKDFMLSVNDMDAYKKCIFSKKETFKDIQDDINRGIKSQNKFSTYLQLDDETVVAMSYLPVYNISRSRALAWVVSYEESPFIANTLLSARYIQLILFFLFLVLTLLLYKVFMLNYKQKKEHKLVSDILNATDDIMFITDFNSVTFSNRKFKDFFSINEENEEKFKALYKNASSMFLEQEGYLYDGLKEKGESFIDLLKRTKKENRIVLILDRFLNKKSFAISTSKISDAYRDSYLVTLTDITKIKEKESQIQQKVYLDGLTGIYNRVKFDEVLQQELHRAMRYSTTLTLTLIDIDHFKSFNDKYGHLIGDEVLVTLVTNISSKLRLSDTFARWGGEEFVILFPETSKEEAIIICEKLRAEIASIPHPIAGHITASFGLTEYKKGDTSESIFGRCDDALYLAKERGRNQVCIK